MKCYRCALQKSSLRIFFLQIKRMIHQPPLPGASAPNGLLQQIAANAPEIYSSIANNEPLRKKVTLNHFL